LLRMTEVSFEKALVPLDLSKASDAIVEWLPKVMRMGIHKLYLHHIVPLTDIEALLLRSYKPLIEEIKEELAEHARKALEAYSRKLKEAGFEVEVLEPAFGDPAENILNISSLLPVDLIILGSKGHKGVKIALGGVSEEVVRKARKPILIAKIRYSDDSVLPPPDPFEGPILVAMAFDTEADAVLSCAFSAAKAAEKSVILLHVLELGEAAGVVVDKLFEIAKLFSEKGVSVNYKVLVGNPAKVILREAERTGAKLIVIGGRTAASHLGTTLDIVLRRSEANILICRHI
jgi:nucleotide-binding universal stress UspA family protein